MDGDQLPLYVLAGTRLTLKTGVKTLRGRISFLPQSLPGKIIITYLIRVLTHFDHSIVDCDQLPLYVLVGTRLTLKTRVKTIGGRIRFLPQSLPVKIIINITYLIRVFDTT